LTQSSLANGKTHFNLEPASRRDGLEVLEVGHLVVVDHVAVDPIAVDPAVGWYRLQILTLC
jgi:hypothetical protein